MASSRQSAHAHAPVAATKHDEGARGNGHAGHATDFLTKKIGLGSHVLVALNRCLAPSQVGRVVGAWRAGAPLASKLEVRGRPPAELVRDPHFGWMAAVKSVAVVEKALAEHAQMPAEHASAALAEKLGAAAVAEVNGSSPSARVLVEVVLVAQRNHVAPALCERLRSTPHRAYGNCFNALLSLTGSEGSAALEHGVEGSLGHAGVDVAPDAAIAKMSAHDRLVRAAKYGGSDLLGETAKQLLGMLPALAAFWAASQLTVLGPTLDLLGIGMMGQQGVQAVQDLLAFRTMAEEARTEADLKIAGAHFAAAIASIGIGGVLGIVGWARGRRARARAKAETTPHETATPQQTKPADESSAQSPAHETQSQPAQEAAPKQPSSAAKPSTAPHESGAEHEATSHQHDAAQSQKKPGATRKARVDHLIEGHADSVDDAVPHGWTITRDHIGVDRHSGLLTAETEVIDPNGGVGHFVRAYDPTTKTLVMDQAFLDPKAPRWLQHKGTMMTPEGTPSQSFWTMRQVRRLKLSAAEVKSVKMSSVQNVKTVMQLGKAAREGLDLASALCETTSVKYAATPMVQLGMHPVAGSVKLSGGDLMPIGELMRYQEVRGLADADENRALLEHFGFKASDMLHIGFDITFDVAPASPGKQQP